MKKLSIKLFLLAMGSFFHTESLQAEEKKYKPAYYPKASDLNLTNDILDLNDFYVGVTGNADFGRSKVNTNVSVDATSILNSSDLSHRRISGGVVAGYGQNIKDIYLGVEVAGEFSNSSERNSFNSEDGNTKSGTVSVRKNNSISIAGRLGKQIDSKTLIYVKAGLASNGYKFSSLASQSMGGITKKASSSKNRRLLQPVAGLGIQRFIGTVGHHIQVHIGAEVEHTFGKSAQVNLNSGGVSGSSKFDTSSDAIKARLLFKI